MTFRLPRQLSVGFYSASRFRLFSCLLFLYHQYPYHLFPSLLGTGLIPDLWVSINFKIKPKINSNSPWELLGHPQWIREYRAILSVPKICWYKRRNQRTIPYALLAASQVKFRSGGTYGLRPGCSGPCLYSNHLKIIESVRNLWKSLTDENGTKERGGVSLSQFGESFPRREDDFQRGSWKYQLLDRVAFFFIRLAPRGGWELLETWESPGLAPSGSNLESNQLIWTYLSPSSPPSRILIEHGRRNPSSCSLLYHTGRIHHLAPKISSFSIRIECTYSEHECSHISGRRGLLWQILYELFRQVKVPVNVWTHYVYFLKILTVYTLCEPNMREK